MSPNLELMDNKNLFLDATGLLVPSPVLKRVNAAITGFWRFADGHADEDPAAIYHIPTFLRERQVTTLKAALMDPNARRPLCNRKSRNAGLNRNTKGTTEVAFCRLVFPH